MLVASRWAASPPSDGEVVLVGGAEPRGRWPLARVLELIRGPDGGCRAAFVEIRGGTYPPTDCEIIPARSFTR